MAELGWTRHAIRTVLGVTPTTMRPPYGDIGTALPAVSFPSLTYVDDYAIDDRVRAIAHAMGLVPIMWTRTPDGVPFDTNGMLPAF